MTVEAASPTATSDPDHVALCGWALSRAADALKHGDIQRAVASLREVEVEAGCARVALLARDGAEQSDESESGSVTMSLPAHTEGEQSYSHPTPRRRKTDWPEAS